MAVFEIPTGVVADSYSRRLSILIGVGLTGAALVLIGLTESFALLLVGQVVWGLGTTFTSGATTACSA